MLNQGDNDVEYIGTLNGVTKEPIGDNLGFTLSFLCSNPIGKDAVGRAMFEPVAITSATLTNISS